MINNFIIMEFFLTGKPVMQKKSESQGLALFERRRRDARVPLRGNP